MLLEKDTSEGDQYGRLLRYVHVGDSMVNEALLGLGPARVAAFPVLLSCDHLQTLYIRSGGQPYE